MHASSLFGPGIFLVSRLTLHRNGSIDRCYCLRGRWSLKPPPGKVKSELSSRRTRKSKVSCLLRHKRLPAAKTRTAQTTEILDSVLFHRTLSIHRSLVARKQGFRKIIGNNVEQHKMCTCVTLYRKPLQFKKHAVAATYRRTWAANH